MTWLDLCVTDIEPWIGRSFVMWWVRVYLSASVFILFLAGVVWITLL